MKIHQEVTKNTFSNKICLVTIRYQVNFDDAFGGIDNNYFPNLTGTVVSKAKCDNLDKFDLTYGYRLAESRATKKMFIKINNFLKNELSLLNKNIKIISEQKVKINKRILNQSEHIDTLVS